MNDAPTEIMRHCGRTSLAICVPFWLLVWAIVWLAW